MFIVQTYIIFQGKSEWKKLKYGPPERLEQLQQMFAHTAVDGSTSCIAGENNGDEGDEEFEREDFEREAFERDAFDSSPMSSGTKRTASTGTCATSPMKKS